MLVADVVSVLATTAAIIAAALVLTYSWSYFERSVIVAMIEPLVYEIGSVRAPSMLCCSSTSRIVSVSREKSVVSWSSCANTSTANHSCCCVVVVTVVVAVVGIVHS